MKLENNTGRYCPESNKDDEKSKVIIDLICEYHQSDYEHSTDNKKDQSRFVQFLVQLYDKYMGSVDRGREAQDCLDTILNSSYENIDGAFREGKEADQPIQTFEIYTKLFSKIKQNATIEQAISEFQKECTDEIICIENVAYKAGFGSSPFEEADQTDWKEKFKVWHQPFHSTPQIIQWIEDNKHIIK